MNQKRIRKTELTILIGTNGSGKTTFLKNEIVAKSKRCLIVTPYHSEWKEVPAINISDIRTFNGTAKIIMPGRSQSNALFTAIANNYSGGILVLDDSKIYINNFTDENMDYIYTSRRQYGVDCYIVGHGLSKIPPGAFTHLSWLVLFSTNENFRRRRDELNPEDLDKIIEKQQLIKKKVEAGNPYYYEIILLDPQIRGEYVRQTKQTK